MLCMLQKIALGKLVNYGVGLTLKANFLLMG